MSYASRLSSNRAVLFANLGQALSNGDKFPQLFENAADISPDCFHRDLTGLATAVYERPDEPLLEHIRASSLFLPWELRFIQFGLATLKIQEVFARLCEYYVLIGSATGRMMKWMAGAWTLLAFTCAFLAHQQVAADLSWGIGVGVGVAMLVLGVLMAPAFLGNWIAPDSRFWRFAAWLPPLRSLVIARSVYQYLLNLGLCIQNGLDLNRSLQLCAKSEPMAWLRQRYQGVAQDVAGGTQVSQAFLASGILAETKLTSHNRPAPPAGGKLWEPGITDVVRDSFTEQLEFVALALPFLLVVPLAFVWVVLAIF